VIRHSKLKTTAQSYRADVDGLRAVAVLGVIMFHANLGFPGGFTGVDIFFVISGYLITGIVSSEVAAGSFSLVKFWERRVRRICPALFVVVTCCLVAGYFLLLPFGYEVLGQTALAVVFVCSNVFFWATTSYFSPNAKENPLLHTWSLGVEEQFYIIYPVLLLAFLARGRSAVLVCLWILCAISFWWSVYSVLHHPSASFYLLPSRAWELGVGGLLALHRNTANQRCRELQSWTGLILLASSFSLLSKHTPFPGLGALPPVLGAALIVWSGSGLAAGDRKPTVTRLLSFRPLVSVGLISYSLYLWHWPFFAFHRYLFGQSAPFATSIVYLLATFLLSFASYRWVEQPFRRKDFLSRPASVFGGWVAGSLVLALAGLVLARTDGFPGRLPHTAIDYEKLQGQPRHVLFAPIGDDPDALHATMGSEGSGLRAFLWGDSHAPALAQGLDQVAKELGVSITGKAMIGNAPVLGWGASAPDSSDAARKLAFNNSVFDQIAESAAKGDLQLVILAFRWSLYVPRSPPLEACAPPPGFAEALVLTVQKLLAMNLKVLIVLEPPALPVHVPKALALKNFVGASLPSVSAEQAVDFRRPYDEILRSLDDGTGRVILFDPLPALCGDGVVLLTDEKGRLMYVDDNHLSTIAARRLVPGLKQKMSAAFNEKNPAPRQY
jgi:peptidoglycan/LPS O-acetylase OafA/YrhL